ncbi:hypothetical protein O987_12305 [Comamonas testosteroni TK102]|uniref:Uncharacterized protein n=1 Tax=Comamonas testosteroni TK102 TaxID=1392005 RepID=A0A076PPL1_COMTE|nr:hypothetical protein O987_12305 [Comamonas testosteroni TK102]
MLQHCLLHSRQDDLDPLGPYAGPGAQINACRSPEPRQCIKLGPCQFKRMQREARHFAIWHRERFGFHLWLQSVRIRSHAFAQLTFALLLPL